MKTKAAFVGILAGTTLMLAVAPTASAHDRDGFFVFDLAAAVVNTAVAVATVPLNIIAGAAAPRYVYYPPPMPYYAAPPAYAYYGPPATYQYGPPPVYYAPPPAYYPPPPPGYYPPRW